MKISAKNQIQGIITEIHEGAVNNEVIIEIAEGVYMTSVLTRSSCERLELEPGKEVFAVVKASNVMVAVDE